MAHAIRHRGPDGEGFHVDAGLALAHRRLTIIDHNGGAQPRVDPDRGDALVFNGEIYGYRALARELRAQGIGLRDHSDTEVLYWLLREQGVETTLEKIDGMFAFAWRDGTTGVLHLVRDAFGQKPLFYAPLPSGQLIFASEIKALLRHPDLHAASPDPATIRQFLAYDYVPAPATGVLGIFKLQAGHRLSFVNGRITVARWHRLPVSGPVAISRVEAADRVEASLSAAIADQLVADVPVGILLSGGIDSSLVAALAAQQAPDLRAFTLKLGAASYDESPYAARVAQILGLRHQVTELGDADVMAAWTTIDNALDEPFADASQLPTALLCQTVRQHVTVALGGDGADELFAGYAPFMLQRFAPLMARTPRSLGPALASCLAALPPSDAYMGLEFRLRQLCQGIGQPAALQPFLWMAAVAPDDQAALLSQDLIAAEPGDPMMPLRNILAAEPSNSAVTELQTAFLRLYLADDILVKTDRASMAASIELRSPFLSGQVVAQSLSLPDRYKLQGSKTKIVLRDIARRHLPPDLVDRKKHGFALPVAEMLRGPLRGVLWDTLLSATHPLAPWFQRPALERVLRQHDRRERDHRKKLWALLCLFRFAGRLPEWSKV